MWRIPLVRSHRDFVILKGMGASRGTASGPARIIFNIQELDKIQSGDVLVAPMTNPDMVVAMAKAVAVITDVGGMTCHAAIISRELGIPCVVGTQKATQILKDGMFVCVNGTKGVVSQVSAKEMGKLRVQAPLKKEIKIFGTEVESVCFKMNRNRPLWSEGWNMPWSEVDTNKEYKWIPPRPEVPTTPLTVSMIMPGVERIPYALGLDTGPLYTALYGCVLHVRLDKIREIMALIADKLITKDEDFVGFFKKNLYEAYADLDKASEDLSVNTKTLENMSSDRIIETFKNWWKVHQKFFSLTFLIQSMGDDIIWPHVHEMLMEKLEDVSTVLDYISILTLPTAEVTSIRFFNKMTELLYFAPPSIRSSIFSNTKVNEIISAASKTKEGNEWLGRFHEFVIKWGWMRDRDPYFEPLNNPSRMLKYIRSYASPDMKPSQLEENNIKFQRCVQDIRGFMPEDFIWFVEMGRFLHMERDVHHHLWLKNTIGPRAIFLELGRRLTENGLFYDPKDVFFVFVPEMLELCSETTSAERKRSIVEKVPNRMVANTFVSKIRYHNRPGYNPGAIPQRDNEYY